jgi:hypothetical protein
MLIVVPESCEGCTVFQKDITGYKDRRCADCPLMAVAVTTSGYVPADGTKTYTVRVEGRE